MQTVNKARLLQLVISMLELVLLHLLYKLWLERRNDFMILPLYFLNVIERYFGMYFYLTHSIKPLSKKS